MKPATPEQMSMEVGEQRVLGWAVVMPGRRIVAHRFTFLTEKFSDGAAACLTLTQVGGAQGERGERGERGPTGEAQVP